VTAYRFTGGLMVDPFLNVMERTDLQVRDGVVVSRQPGTAPEEIVRIDGCWVVPRITDLHVHFRDPGQTWKEDWVSGVRAAAAGGVTTVGVMPNTVPVVDSPAAVSDQIARAGGRVRVWPIGALSRGSRGREAAPWAAMQAAGARAFSDDGRALYDPALMAAALSWSRHSGLPVIQHLEDPILAAGGVVHAGEPARRLGLPGQPAASESVLAFRDVALAAEYGGRLHLAHCSVPGTLQALGWARGQGLPVTGEATPHHCLASDEWLLRFGDDAVTKVNPPLRPQAAQEAVRAALVSGLLTVFASDHAPHSAAEKAAPYVAAPFGISGIETLVGAVLTLLWRDARLSPLKALAPVTVGPHQVVGEAFSGLVGGAPADLTVIDPNAAWTVDPARFYSQGRNTPLAGLRLQGRVVATMVGGRFTFRDGEVLV
jgi:dihydroorotase